MGKKQDSCRYSMDDGIQCPNTKTRDSQFCEQHANWLVADLEVYRVITDHFKQDVREFWVRSNFYLLVQAGLLAVFATGITLPASHDKVITITLGILGLIIAICWFLSSRGAVMWIRRWREQAIEIDKVVDRHRIYAKVESYAKSNPFMSPSNVTQYLPVFFCIAWAVLLVFSFLDNGSIRIEVLGDEVSPRR